MLTFHEYANQSAPFARYPFHHLPLYPIIGLTAEVGELSEVIQKHIRTMGYSIPLDDSDRAAALSEIGDCLWYLNAVARDLGLTLEAAALANIAKLSSRYAQTDTHQD